MSVYIGKWSIKVAGKKAGRLINLEEPLESDLVDFCSAHYDAPATSIIRAAVRQFIDERLAAEPEMRKRFEAARKARLSGKSNVRLIEKGE